MRWNDHNKKPRFGDQIGPTRSFLWLFVVGAMVAIVPATFAQESATTERPPAKTVDEAIDRWARAVQTGDAAEIKRLFDWDAIYRLAVKDAPDGFAQRAFFRRGLNEAANRGEPMQFCSREIARGGDYRLLSRAGNTAVFRMVFSDGTVNWHRVDCALVDDVARVVDYETALTGEKLSNVFRRNYLRAVDPDLSVFSGPFDPILLGGTRGLQEISLALHERRPQDAWDQYADLPEPFLKEKGALSLRIQAARDLADDKRLVTACDDFAQAFVGSSFVRVAELTSRLTANDATGAIASLDAIVKEEGLAREYREDPYLDVLRAEILLELGDLDGGREAARRADSHPAGQPFGSWAMLSVRLKSEEFEEAVRLIDSLDREMGAKAVDHRLTRSDATTFRASPAFQRWLDRRGR